MDKFIEKCKEEICERENISIEDAAIFTVWSCKTIQNKKVLLASNHKKLNHLYFECTYNGDAKEIYFDCYRKVDKFIVEYQNGGTK